MNKPDQTDAIIDFLNRMSIHRTRRDFMRAIGVEVVYTCEDADILAGVIHVG